MSQQNASQARTVTTAEHSGTADVSSLVLLAVLLAAGFILNMTVGNALAIVGIKPQFIIASYALAILLSNAGFGQAAVFGLVSAAVIQLTTSIPGLNFATELVAALIDQCDTIEDGIRHAQQVIDGSMTLLLLTKDGMYAARDYLGRTPLILGKKEDEQQSSNGGALLNLLLQSALK